MRLPTRQDGIENRDKVYKTQPQTSKTSEQRLASH